MPSTGINLLSYSLQAKVPLDQVALLFLTQIRQSAVFYPSNLPKTSLFKA